MKAYEVDPGAGDHALRRVDRPDPSVGPGEVVIRVRAASLNFRDLLVMDNIYGIESGTLIPLSDAAGDIVEVGPGVERLRIGDRVSPSFYPDWISGAITERKKARALGGTIDGVSPNTSSCRSARWCVSPPACPTRSPPACPAPG